MKTFLFLIGVAMATQLVSCKKGSDGTHKGKRISSISSPQFNHLYNYDAQNRLAGIDYSVSDHMKVEYSASGIIFQWYDGAGNPTNQRMEMNLVNGRIQYIVETVGNHKNEHGYQYDGEGRMTRAQAKRTTISSNQLQSNGEAIFTWNGDQLIKTVHTRWDRDGIKTDSLIWDMSYYEEKKFITWDDVGFPYLGKAPLAGMATGFGYRLPITFLSEGIMPSVAAVKGVVRKSYSYHAGQWHLTNSTSDYPESYYQYDEQGKLSKWLNNIDIRWK